ncbi:50S ribosomal protein L9 [bacterium]|nr:50S ribosomal protein L9 [bacterium]
MEILLRKPVEHLGEAGDIVQVAAGYARNYLLPRKLATPVTSDNLNRLEADKRRVVREAERHHQTLVELAERLEGTSCTIAAQASDSGTLFGSVAAPQIAEALRQEGYDIPDRAVQLEAPIKETGVYAVTIVLAPEAEAVTRIWVVAD